MERHLCVMAGRLAGWPAGLVGSLAGWLAGSLMKRAEPVQTDETPRARALRQVSSYRTTPSDQTSAFGSQMLGGIACLTLILQYGLVCFLRHYLSKRPAGRKLEGASASEAPRPSLPVEKECPFL